MADGEVEALRAFRAGLFVGFGRRRDALLEVLDALLTAGPVPSLPHLSLAPGHRRGWGSVYAALRRGHVHAEALRALLLRQPMPDGPPLYAVDVSVWPRPGAATSPERGYQYHSPRRRDGRDPVVPGWAYQWLTRLSWDRDSWTAPVDVRRVRPEEKPTALAVEQLKALVAARPAAQRGEVPLVLFDAGYDASGFTDALAGTPVALLIRLRSNRHFWFAPARADGAPAGPPEAARGQVRLRRPGHLARPDRRAARHRRGLRPGAGAGLGGPPHLRAAPRAARASSGSTGAPGAWPTGRWCAWRSAASPAGGARPDVVWLWWQPPPEPGASRAAVPRGPGRPVAGVLPESRSGADLQIPEAGPRLGHARGCACPSRPTAGPGWCSPPTPSCASPAGPSPTTGCRGSAPSPRPGSRPRGCTGVLRPHSVVAGWQRGRARWPGYLRWARCRARSRRRPARARWSSVSARARAVASSAKGAWAVQAPAWRSHAAHPARAASHRAA